MEKLLQVSIIVVLLTSCGKQDPPPQQAEPQQETPPTDNQLAVVVEAKLLTYEQRQGKHLYQKFCQVCHGEHGKGDGFNAFNLEPKPRDFTNAKYMSALSDARLVETISQGGRGVNKSPLMPSWGGRLKGEEFRYLVSYLRALHRTQ